MKCARTFRPLQQTMTRLVREASICATGHPTCSNVRARKLVLMCPACGMAMLAGKQDFYGEPGVTWWQCSNCNLHGPRRLSHRRRWQRVAKREPYWLYMRYHDVRATMQIQMEETREHDGAPYQYTYFVPVARTLPEILHALPARIATHRPRNPELAWTPTVRAVMSVLDKLVLQGGLVHDVRARTWKPVG